MGKSPSLLLPDLDRGQRGGHDRGSDTRGKYEARRGVLQELDQLLAAGNVAAATAQRLAQSSHPDVDLARIHPKVLCDPAPVLSQHPGGVRVVDHQQRPVAPLDLDELWKIGNVPVHAVNTLDGDQHAAVLGPELLEQPIGHLPVVVRERTAPGAGEDASLDDTVMRQGVVQDQIAGAQQVTDHRLVRGVTAGHCHGVFDSRKTGNRLLQLPVQVFLTGDQPAGRDAGAVAVYGVLGGPGNLGMPRHPLVVEAGKIDHVFSVDNRPVAGHALVRHEERIADARGLQHIQVPPQLNVLGELVETVSLRRDHRTGRAAGLGSGLAAEVLQHCVDDLAGGFQVGKDVFGKAPAEAFLQRGQNLHALQRIQPRLHDRRIERQPGNSLLAHPAYLFQHNLGSPFPGRHPLPIAGNRFGRRGLPRGSHDFSICSL